MEESLKKEIAIVGCGKVGTALGYFLSKKGYSIAGISCTSKASLKRAVGLVDAKKSSLDALDIAGLADIVFLSVPDGEIKSVCDRLAAKNAFREKAAVFHLSGALSSEILSSVTGRCFTGSIHPLQSFAVLDEDINPFLGIVMSAEGHKRAIDAAHMLADDLDADFTEIRTESKTLYHAAAVVSSNYLVTLMDFSLSLMKRTGLPDDESFNLLKPLISGTLSNIEKNGTVKALTGPVSRGDLSVIKNHLDGIKEKSDEFSELYKVLGRHTVDVAEKSGSLSKDKVKELKDLFL